ncbi:F-box protein, partial [Candidatus Dependentiae bacterium]
MRKIISLVLFFSILSNSFSVFGMRGNREYFHPKKRKKTIEKTKKKLLDLPAEILEHKILPHLDKKTKINFSMTCEEMREIFYKKKIFVRNSDLIS